MAPLDWILLAVLLVSLVLGLVRGLVYQVISLAGWVGAFYLAQWLAPQAAEKLPMGGASEPLRFAAGFVLVFIGGLFAAGLVAWGVKKIVASIGLSPVDRLLGGVFGLVRGAVLLLAAAVVVNMTALKDSAWWQESQGAPLLTAALRGLKPALPEEFGRYLPS